MECHCCYICTRLLCCFSKWPNEDSDAFDIMTVFKHESMAFSDTFHVGGRLVNFCEVLVKLGFQGFIELLFELRLLFDCVLSSLFLCVLLLDLSFNRLFNYSCQWHYLLRRSFWSVIYWKVDKLLELGRINQTLSDYWFLQTILFSYYSFRLDFGIDCSVWLRSIEFIRFNNRVKVLNFVKEFVPFDWLFRH